MKMYIDYLPQTSTSIQILPQFEKWGLKEILL